MLDRQLEGPRMPPATLRRITPLVFTRTYTYGLQPIAAPGLVADVPDEPSSHRPSI